MVFTSNLTRRLLRQQIQKIFRLVVIIWSAYVLFAWILSLFGQFNRSYFFTITLLTLLATTFLMVKGKGKIIQEVNTVIRNAPKDFLSTALLFVTFICWTFFIIYCFTQVVISPPDNWDSMTYHLTKIAHAEQRGTLWYSPKIFVSRVNYSPSNSEILNMAASSLLPNDVLVELPQLISSAIIPLALYYIATTFFKAPKKWAAFSTISILTIPLYWTQAITTQNDLLFIGIFLIAGIFTYEFQKNQTKPNLIYAILAISLLIGTKYHGLLAGGILSLGLVWSFIKNPRKIPLLIDPLVIAVIAIGCILALPNYLIAQIYYGNFLYQVGKFGNYYAGIDVFMKNITHFKEWLLTKPFDQDLYYNHDIGHTGTYFLATIFPLLIILSMDVRKKLRSGSQAIFFYIVLATFALVFFSMHPPDPWDLRLILLIPITFIFSFSITFLHNSQLLAQEVFTNKVWRTKIIILFCLPIIIATYVQTKNLVNYYEESTKHKLSKLFKEFNTTNIGENEQQKNRYHSLYRFNIDNNNSANVLIVGSEDTWVYPFYGSNWNNNVSFNNIANFDRMELSKNNWDYIIIGKHGNEYWRRISIDAEVLSEDNFLKIYKLGTN